MAEIHTYHTCSSSPLEGLWIPFFNGLHSWSGHQITVLGIPLSS